MNRRRQSLILFALFFVLSILSTSCGGKEITKTPSPTKGISPMVTFPLATVPHPPYETPGTPDTMIICTSKFIDTMYPYPSPEPALGGFQQAIFDGPIDNQGFSYYPVILEKLPNLANDDAAIQPIIVSEGDLIVDAGQNVVTLQSGIMLRPSGCQADDCAVLYEGGEVLMDQMEVIFQFIPGITWSDGVPLNGADSVFAYNNYPDSFLGSSEALNRTAAYELIEELAFRWKGFPGFLDPTYFLNMWPPVAAHTAPVADHLDFTRADQIIPIGWGPYVIDDWHEDAVSLKRTPSYFRADENLPRFEYFVYKFTGENYNSSVASILSGECDIVEYHLPLDINNSPTVSPRSTQFDLLRDLKNAGQIDYYFAPGDSWNALFLSLNPNAHGVDPSLADAFDVQTRQAFTRCMDRQAAMESYIPTAEVMDSYLPPQHPLENPMPGFTSYNVKAGSAMLEDMGWRDQNSDGVRGAYGIPGIQNGTSLTVAIKPQDDYPHQRIAHILAESMQACGFQVEVLEEDQNILDSDQLYWLSQTTFPIGFIPPCDSFMDGNIPGYSNPEFDAACQSALNSLPGQPNYEKFHLLAQEIFSSDFPIIPLFPEPGILYIFRPDFCGFSHTPSLMSEMWNMEEFGYGPLCTEGPSNKSFSP